MAFTRSNNETYIIAEIGQNHNGDINIAKKLIDQLDRYPYDETTGNRLNKVNAIKLTKRELMEELTPEASGKAYNSVHAFGKTYGEHREFLELSYEDHVELGHYIKARGFDFIETLCSISTLKLLEMGAPIDRIKVASRDLTNIPLLHAISKTDLPVILSTGMATEKEVGVALECFHNSEKRVTLLHCISEYPAKFHNIKLMGMEYLGVNPNIREIGYSDHSIGTHIAVAAVAMGAQVIEKHVTLSREMKGTDHVGSLEPQEFFRMVHDIRTLELAFGRYEFPTHEAADEARVKLGRSVAYRRELPKGRMLRMSDIHMVSPGDGLPWNARWGVVGQKLIRDVSRNEHVDLSHLTLDVSGI